MRVHAIDDLLLDPPFRTAVLTSFAPVAPLTHVPADGASGSSGEGWNIA